MSTIDGRRKIEVVYKSDPVRGEVWRRIFAEEAPEMALRFWPEAGDTSETRYLAAWIPPDELARRFPRLDILFSMGAGVDQLDIAAISANVEIVRMVDHELTRSMVEYAVCGVLALHRDIPIYLRDQRQGQWAPLPVRRAVDRSVGIMGLGVLGTALASALAPFGFKLRGWSRSPKSIEGMETFAGAGELHTFLSGSEILVVLLPLTVSTRGMLDAAAFAALPHGARLLNVGRGGHVVEADLAEALASGRIDCAMLDVLAEEPPPQDHPLMRHPRVMVTPHIASATYPVSAARRVIELIRRRAAETG
jgi:glyoxylate/hydroxypyruvate reductase A